MGKSYIEKRIVKAGIRLCKERIERKGTPITADDLRGIKVPTMSPALRVFYSILGAFFIVFGIWIQNKYRVMAYSFAPVMTGFANIAFAIYGRPKSVAELEKDIDLMGLTADIVKSFVKEMDDKRSGSQ